MVKDVQDELRVLWWRTGLTGAAVSSYFFGSGAGLGSRLLSFLIIDNTEGVLSAKHKN